MIKEMKIMSLAKTIYQMDKNAVVDFASGDEKEVDACGGWHGIRQYNPFDNDNLIYIVGHYGGEACTWLYTISEYDSRIGDFCEKELNPWDKITDQNYINCIARMLVDLFERQYGYVPEILTVDMEDE